MCRVIRNHPIRTIFVILITLTAGHLILKLLNESVSLENNHVSINTPLSLNVSNQVISVVNTDRCKVNVQKLSSSISINQDEISMNVLENESWAADVKNGSWSPPNCSPKDSIALIIPYRNREKHLNIFLRHMHPFLQKQLISYSIFVIEQAPGTRFNRAALFNVGFKEAEKSSLPYNCFIFHDVDLLPTNENNFYKCGKNPVHLSVAIDKFNYRLPYNSIFGGAVALSKEQFQKMNGFSNIFFGWGGEDDDMSSRLSAVHYSILRYPNSVARYVMIRHSGDHGNPTNDARWKLLKDSNVRYKIDGISTLNYTLISNISHSNLIKFISVQFPEKDILAKWKI